MRAIYVYYYIFLKVTHLEKPNQMIGRIIDVVLFGFGPSGCDNVIIAIMIVAE